MTSPSPALFDTLTFCLSGPFSVSAKEIKSLLQSQGGRVSSSLTSSTTHLLTDSPPPSKKVSEALNKGKAVVNEKWVRDCIQAGTLLPISSTPSEEEEEVEAEEEEEGDKADGGMVVSPVFDGLTFVLAGPFSSHSLAEMRQLIEGEKGGGRVASSLTKAVTHVIAESLGSKKTDGAEKKGLPIMKPQWIVACIAQGKLITDPAMECKAREGKEERRRRKRRRRMMSHHPRRSRRPQPVH